MKKYIYPIFTALSALLLLASCHQEEEVVVQKPSLKVVSSDVIFGVEGGQGTIVVEADGAVSVTSERPWVQTSVSGNTITVTVSEPNQSHLSRYSRLTISSGSDNAYVTVHQFGEIFDGMKLADVDVEQGGATLRYAFKANMSVQMTSDQPWVHFAVDEENEGIMVVTVDENPGFGTRFATVSFAAGSNSGSMKITQEPKFAAVEGWKVENTDGWFDFPDQVDVIAVTPPAGWEEKPYFWATADPVAYQGVDVPSVIRNSARQLRENHGSDPSFLTKGPASAQVSNLPTTILGVIICFDDDFYPTGEYALVEVSIPDRGPVKQQVDGWEIVHTGGSYLPPDQQDEFTITPKPGFEDVKYIATAVKKDAISSVEDFAFTSFAMETRQAILDKVAAGELASFEDGLLSGTSTITAKNVPGDVYVVVVAFGNNKFYTGDYGVESFVVAGLKHDIWLGTWTMTNDAGQTYTWTIADKGDDSGNFTMYCDGLYTGTGALLKRMTWFDLDYNEDGSVTLNAQTAPEKAEFYNSTYGDIYPGLFGFYDSGGKTYYRTAVPYEILTLSITEEGVATVTHIGDSSGNPYHSFKVYYWSSVKAARFSFTSNVTLTIAGLKLTKQ